MENVGRMVYENRRKRFWYSCKIVNINKEDYIKGLSADVYEGRCFRGTWPLVPAIVRSAKTKCLQV